MSAADPRNQAFEGLRPRLFGIAYRMVGTRAEAEDIVQEAWIRLERAGGVSSLEGFLVKAVTRLSIDHLRSGRVRRETYVGPWLPEPLVTSEDDPAREVERLELLSLALLRVVDRLEPLERAAFLLREVFSYDYAEVARIVGKREDHCRQLVHRARTHLKAERPRVEATEEEHRRLLAGFLKAAAQGDLEVLESLLLEDVVLLSDSGGKAKAARNPVRGRNAVARFMAGITAKGDPAARLDIVRLNGLPGAVVWHNGQIVLAMSLDVREGAIGGVFMTRNPDKLAALGG